MTQRMETDATKIRTGLRQTEGALDEALLETTGLLQAMLRARQNPGVVPHTGQRSIMRLTRAMQRQVEAASDLFRVHDEMSEIGVAHGVLDRDGSTPLSGLDGSEPALATTPSEAA